MASSTTTITTPTTALSLSTVLTTSQPPCLHRCSPSTSYFSVKLSPSKLKSLKFSSFSPKILSPYVVSASSSDTSAGNSDYVSVPIEKCFPAFPTVLDINEIRAILPHRFPFLLVDRVVEYNPGVTAVAIKNVTINDNFFPGHFPQRPIMPGVLMVEAMAQVGGLVVLKQEVGGPQANFFFAGIDKVRFRKPVIAGDTLVMRMTLIKLQKRFGIAKMEGKAYVGGELVCEGEFLMAMAGDSRE